MALSNINQQAIEAAQEASEVKKTKAPKKGKVGGDKAKATAESAPEMEWDFLKVTQNKDGYFSSVQIRQTGFIKLLQSMGYRRYDKADGSFIVVKVVDNIVEEVSIPALRIEAVRYFSRIDENELNIMTSCPKGEMMEKLYRSLGSLVNEEKLSLLVDLEHGNEFNFCQDTLTTAYYFYENGFVEVSKTDGISLKPYTELPGCVWRSQIHKRPFTVLPTEDAEKSVFFRFLQNVAHTKGESDATNANRLEALMSITGYNLHRFFNQHLRASILLDARKTDEPDGRSGKSLFCKALRFILNGDADNGPQCRIIDGKTFDPDNRFKYEELAHNTQLVVFDDIKRGIDITQFFNAIPDGISVERKGAQGKERIHAKIIFTLNYTLSIRGGSAKDRVVEFEFADYYSSTFKPEQEFGHWFFRDWNPIEWNRFDNLMMQSVALYFQKGIVLCNSINLNERKLRDETCPEFITFMDDINPVHQEEYDKKALYKRFVDLDSDGNIRNKDLKWMTMRKFTAFLQRYAEYTDNIAGYHTRRSNGSDFILFLYNRPFAGELPAGAVIFPDKSDQLTPIPDSQSPTAAEGGEDLPF